MLTLKLPPGLFKNGTEFQSKGRFYEADLWRWFDGAQRPVGGWRQKGTSSVTGVGRAILNWRANDNAVWIGIGTNSGLYAMSRSGTLTNVAPVAVAATGTITVSGTPVANETFVVGAQTFTFKAARAVLGEVTISAVNNTQATNIVAAIAADLATVTAVAVSAVVTVTAATAGTAGNSLALTEAATGVAVSGSGFLTGGVAALVAGSVDAATGGGYGTGLYGKGFYGAPTADSTNVIPASMWTLDTYGENLIGCFGSVIYEWPPNVAVKAAVLTNAPSAEAILATEERSIFALGASGNPRRVTWCDLENNTVWTPSGTNQAGGKTLQTGGKLLCGRRIKGGSLIFTDADVHRAEYVGLPQVYAFERLATGCGPISKGAVVTVGSLAFWMGLNGFWIYNGGVDPLPCDLSDYLYRNLNVLQASKVTTMHNSAFGEVWWMYPSGSATECDRVVVLNYRENHWNDFALVRLSGVDRGVLPYPLMVSTAGAVFEHEAGNARDGRQPYARCGPVEMGDGEREMTVHAIIPDELATGDVTVSFVTRDWTMSAAETFGPYAAASKTDCFFTARSVAPKFTAVADRDFRIGNFRFDVRKGPRR